MNKWHHQSGLRRRYFNFIASFSISDDKLPHSLTLRRGLYKRFLRISLTGCFNFAIYTHRRESEIKRPSLVAREEILNPDLKWICIWLNILGLSQWCVYTRANPGIYLKLNISADVYETGKMSSIVNLAFVFECQVLELNWWINCVSKRLQIQVP